MKVELMKFDDEKAVAIGARLCYFPTSIQDLKEELTDAKAGKLIKKLKELGHSSPFEHVSYTFGIEGVSRTLMAQITRHRIASYCLSGDTKIMRYNNNRGYLTLKELYDRQNDKQLIGRNKLLQLRSMNEHNIIVPNKLKNVIKSGLKTTYILKTKLGYEIKSSKEHIFFNNKGEIQLKDLNVGDVIYVNGIELYKDKEWFKKKYIDEGLNTTLIAKLCNIATCTARKWKRIHAIKTINKNMRRNIWNKGIIGPLSHNYGRKVSNETRLKLSKAKLGINHKKFEELTDGGKRIRFGKLEKIKCDFCGETNNLENHHKDGDINNGNISNKLCLCMLCHKLIHKGPVVKKVILDKIISIEKYGNEMTYDLEMENPYHNFVANGFIVHNSIQSQRYVKENNFEYIIPPSIKDGTPEMDIYVQTMVDIQKAYNTLISEGIRKEDARFVLPGATETKIIMTINARSLQNFFNLRRKMDAQWEIRMLADKMYEIVSRIHPNIWENDNGI